MQIDAVLTKQNNYERKFFLNFNLIGGLSMKWMHEFYQINPDDSNNSYYFFSQRRARAILESVKEIKKGYYKAKVVSIESDDEFEVMCQGGGCTHQYYIGEIFTLRRHKNKNNHDCR